MHIWGKVYFGIIVFSSLSVFKIPFNLFCMGEKRLLQSSLGNEVDFRDIMNVSLNILAKN